MVDQLELDRKLPLSRICSACAVPCAEVFILLQCVHVFNSILLLYSKCRLHPARPPVSSTGTRFVNLADVVNP